MRRKKSSRSYLSSLYSRMSKAAQAGMRRLRGRANRAGPEHLAADAAEFDYIEREAHDILAAVARLRARDAAETMAPEAYASEPMLEAYNAPEVYAIENEPIMLEPMPDTIADYAPEASANQARGRRRRANRAGHERIAIEYGTKRANGGWHPVYWINGRERYFWTPAAHDKDRALAMARAEAEHEAARYVGDWTVTVRQNGGTAGNRAGLTAHQKMARLQAEAREARQTYETFARLESLTRDEREEKARAYARLQKIERAIYRMRSR